MSYSVRHQVFVSSTFTDLKEERAEVIQAIWELDCIPTGMEAFVASNESQWDVIRRVIDECDYYVLIIGGRYGSITSGGVSYTEKEYRYAKQLGIPVLAFVHGSPEDIAYGKSEQDETARAKLSAFREEVMKDHPIRSWSSPAELGGLVSRSLVREVKVHPRPGWIRNDGSSPIALLEQINKLTEENRLLRETAAVIEDDESFADFASGADKTELTGNRTVSVGPFGSQRAPWATLASWDEIWRDLGPALLNEASETSLRELLARFHLLDTDETAVEPRSPDVDVETWSEVLIQFRALGFMVPGTKKRGVNDRGSYWAITPRGDRHLVSLLAIRKEATPA